MAGQVHRKANSATIEITQKQKFSSSQNKSGSIRAPSSHNVQRRTYHLFQRVKVSRLWLSLFIFNNNFWEFNKDIKKVYVPTTGLNVLIFWNKKKYV